MTVSCIDVAEEILSYLGSQGKRIAPYELSKYLYFVQAYSYARHGRPIFEDMSFVVREKGPVSDETEDTYTGFEGAGNINRLIGVGQPILSNDDISLIHKVTDLCNKKNFEQLSQISHDGKLWKKYWDDGKGIGKIIPYEEIEKFFCGDEGKKILSDCLGDI